MTHSGRSRNGGAQPPTTISIRGLEAGPRLTPNSISPKNRPLSAIVDRLVIFWLCRAPQKSEPFVSGHLKDKFLVPRSRKNPTNRNFLSRMLKSSKSSTMTRKGKRTMMLERLDPLWLWSFHLLLRFSKSQQDFWELSLRWGNPSKWTNFINCWESGSRKWSETPRIKNNKALLFFLLGEGSPDFHFERNRSTLFFQAQSKWKKHQP